LWGGGSPKKYGVLSPTPKTFFRVEKNEETTKSLPISKKNFRFVGERNRWA